MTTVERRFNAELNFMETVPASLLRIAEATEKIAQYLSKTNSLEALHMMVECGSPGFKKDVMEVLGKNLGLIKDPAEGEGGKEGAEP